MKKHTAPSRGELVVLVATADRPRLLINRALRSVYSQSVVPDRIIVVDDSKILKSQRVNERYLRRYSPAVEYLRNRRTKGLSGALNSGLDHCLRFTRASAKDVYVAVLDDDDAWESDHLEACQQVAFAQKCSMVASGLIRHDSEHPEGVRHTIPTSLEPRELFIRGQHIQGSNLFFQLDLVLAAGCFDERLPSCTDRDLCLRLAALPELRFGSTGRHTVHHHADEGRDRLSCPRSETKLDGLTRFWRKHADRFDPAAQEAARDRALRLFGWRLPENPRQEQKPPPLVKAERSLELIIGFITDAEVPSHTQNLLNDILDLTSRPDVTVAMIVIVENGPLPANGKRPLQDLVQRFVASGLPIELVTIERQQQDWRRGRLMDTPDPAHQRLPIAAMRTTLNSYVAHLAVEYPECAAWILDDDKRLFVDIDLGSRIERRPALDVATLVALKDKGVDIVIGPDTGAPPLPFSATFRMQLLDLERMLGVLEVSSPNQPWLNRRSEEAEAHRSMPDTYYDLAKTTEHLETPFWFSPTEDSPSLGDCLEGIAGTVDRLRAGEAVFRPLAIKPDSLASSAATDSVQRGGSTIFFRPEHLLEYPQTLARIGDCFVRRSDMMVTVLMRDKLGLRAVMHPAAGVCHDRSSTHPVDLDDPALKADILGYALFRAFDELMQARSLEHRRQPLIAWGPDELKDAVRLVNKYLEERLAAFSLNAWRILGLAKSISTTARRLANGASFGSDRRGKEHLLRIASEMDQVREAFDPATVTVFAEGVKKTASEADICNAFLSMDGLIHEYRATVDLRKFNSLSEKWIAAREARARDLLARFYGSGPLRLLGAGGEGIVFTDEERVYKVLDLLKPRSNHDPVKILRTLCNPSSELKHLYSLERVEIRAERLIITYPYETSEPYYGGMGRDLIGLLRECKRHGIVFRNMHPKNVRVVNQTVKLIDYGSDLRPYSDPGYRSMAERAWLSWRFSHRLDLDELMTRVLQGESLPEMDGFERFWTAVIEEKPSATRIVSDLVDPLVFASGAKTVLDYGCGKKAYSSRRYAEQGLSCLGFDPGAEMPEKWQLLGMLPADLTLTTNREDVLKAAPFDSVVSSLVLCELEEGDAFQRVLGDLRAAVKPDGIVIVTVCNPFATFGPPTNLHFRRDLPLAASYDKSFWFRENGGASCGRPEFHRPLRQLEHRLLQHGLRVERRISSATVDLERFEPASDFLTLICRPVTTQTPEHQVSLLIKTCAMEAATLERQVTHLVHQLESPRVFKERVLVIDFLRDEFTRQHSPADMDGLLRAAHRLQRTGVIDRLLRPPESGEAAGEILRSWFGLPCENTHTCKGAPLVAPLWAIEQCSGEYVLQVDSDLLIRRNAVEDDYLAEMMAAIENSATAVTASLSVPSNENRPFTATNDGQPWRVEARGCLLHKARLLRARPFPNSITDGKLVLSWHRSMDESAREGRIQSLRGACHSTAFVHPGNEFKRSVEDWMLILDAIEKFPAPIAQIGKVDLVDDPLEWIPRQRAEPFVFIVTGRNVDPGRAMRCLESMARQKSVEWGAVIIDDESSSLSADSLRIAVEPWKHRITLIQPRERRGQLANMMLAIRHVCTNPQSVIVTLDLDDTLIGDRVLARLEQEYLRGADVTIGSMLRTDKHVVYPVVLDNPRKARGGNVWQHLRSFRKHLFDAICDQDLRINGRYVDIAVDWSFMLPIVEMAEHPIWINEPLYLYEPSGMGKGADRAKREEQVAAIVAKPARFKSSIKKGCSCL